MRIPTDINREPIILFRSLDEECEEELDVAGCYFPIFTIREAIPSNRLVIPRYSILPYPDEVEAGVAWSGSWLINTLEQHKWIADFKWYKELVRAGIETPTSWTWEELQYADYTGPFVVKGATNSKKWNWDTMMYAPTLREAHRIAADLRRDSMIGQQDIIYREYRPLKTNEVGINGVPFSMEWRFFFLGSTLLASGYYWSPAEKHPKPSPAAIRAATEAAEVISKFVNFFVVDVAETEDGDYIVVEVNDGQMSGLSEICPDTLYSNLECYYLSQMDWSGLL